MTPTPVFPQSPRTDIATLTGATALTGRGNITGTTGLVQLVPTTTDGYRLDSLLLKFTGNTAAGLVGIWIFDGTTSFLWRELSFSVVNTASTTTASSELLAEYTNVTLKATEALYISETVSQDLTVFAHGGGF